MLSLPDFKNKQIIICNAVEGQKLSIKNDNIIIKQADETIVLQMTCYKIFSVWIIGGISLTSVLIERGKKFGFSIYLLSYSHRINAVINSIAEGNFLLRQKQYAYKKNDIARWLILNKINNQINLLKSIRSKEKRTIEIIDKLEIYLRELKDIDDVQNILGLEGTASRLFFKEWYKELDWKGRQPRTKTDYLNTLLDIGYTYLFNFIENFLHLYGFDVYMGVYHKQFYMRKSLVCDLVEPFRCIIDKKIKTGYNLGQIKKDDFEERQGQYFLKIEKNKYYIKIIVEEILLYKEEIFVYLQQYYRCFMREKLVEEFPTFEIK